MEENFNLFDTDVSAIPFVSGSMTASALPRKQAAKQAAAAGAASSEDLLFYILTGKFEIPGVANAKDGVTDIPAFIGFLKGRFVKRQLTQEELEQFLALILDKYDPDEHDKLLADFFKNFARKASDFETWKDYGDDYFVSTVFSRFSPEAELKMEYVKARDPLDPSIEERSGCWYDDDVCSDKECDCHFPCECDSQFGPKECIYRRSLRGNLDHKCACVKHPGNCRVLSHYCVSEFVEKLKPPPL